jgi:hypothetical protein
VKGKDAWNAWRRDPANQDVRVTFASIDFSEAPNQINFQAFEFGDHANLSQCKWRGGNWEEIQKDPGNFTRGCVNFTAATFGDEASFTGAVFGDCAKFTSVTFGERATSPPPPSVTWPASSARHLVTKPISSARSSES